MNKPEKNTYLKISIMITIFALLFYIGIFQLPSQIKSETNLVVQNKEEATKLEIQNKQVDNIKKDFEKMENNFDKIANTIVKYSEIYDFISEVKDNVGNETGVTFQMTSGDMQDIDDQLAFVNYNVDVSGEFNEIMNFFDYMENLKYRNDIEEISMSQSSGNLINVNAKMKVYVWK